jgi:hypothetical protein
VELPASAMLQGATWERGSGCTGFPIVDCFIDYVPSGETTRVIFELLLGGSGTQSITATARADRDANPADNSSTVALTVGTPLPDSGGAGSGGGNSTSTAPVSITQTSLLVGRDSNVPVTVGCTGICRGTITLSVTVDGDAAQATRRVVIGTVQFRVGKGRTKLKLRLNSRGRTLLRSRPALKAQLTVISRDANGKPVKKTTRAVTIRRR